MVHAQGRSVGTSLASTSKTTLYTVPKLHSSVVAHTFVVNNSTGTTNFNFAWTDSSSTDTEYDLTIASTILAKQHEYFSWNLPLDESDTVNVTASSTLTCNITLSLDETFTERNRP